ncbi:MAG: hypothetical protein AAF984_05345 [Verrucomicrobiota bacterium]
MRDFLKQFGLLSLVVFLSDIAWANEQKRIQLGDDDAMRIGKRIWKNECSGTVEGLTMWNKGEEFPSLGIGHFIWYPVGYEGPFAESFPKVVAFMLEQGDPVPQWLRTAVKQGAPWPDRETFYKVYNNEQMRQLRHFLVETIKTQARFAARRMEEALDKILATLESSQAAHVKKQFYRVATHPHGVYVLMDYVNFKGEGTNINERYAGKGWGLLQVLEEMQGSEAGELALDEFADKSIFVLQRRVHHSDPKRGEQRWMAGWTNRCNTYRISGWDKLLE